LLVRVIADVRVYAMPFDYAALEAELNSLGEEVVRAKYRRDEYLSHNIKNRFVQDWLREKDDLRRAAREAETLSIARRANAIATIAIAIAAITAIVTIIFQK
jgi:hypothetical protein